MRVRHVIFGLGLVAMACDGSGGDSEGSKDGAVTYYGQIRSLIEANCLGCHVEGGIGPFPLDTLQSVTDERQLVVAEVSKRAMPPWPASSDCRDLRDVRALSDDEVALFEQWRDAGFPDGNKGDYHPPEATPQLTPGDPSMLLLPADGYVPDTSINDEYRCFLTEGTFAEDTYVTAMDIRPDVRSQVHHVQVHKISASQIDAVKALDDAAAGSGYPCAFGVGTGIASVNMFSWRPGSTVVQFDSGDAALIEAGSAIVLQVHYNNQFLEGAAPQPDRSGVAFWTMPAGEIPERIIVRTGQFGPVGPTDTSPFGMIPAGDPDVVGEATASMSLLSTVNGQFVAGEVIGMTPHMHTLGTRLSSTLTRADGTQQCMIDVPSWDFEWQLDYYYSAPELYGPDDTLTVRCEYDNSAANQPFLDGAQIQPRAVTWGEGSLDEMCLNYVWFRYDRAAFMAAQGATL